MDISVNKDREMDLELLKLKLTLQVIDNEILVYLTKRKDIGQYILDYRKKALEEFKDDEDKIAEYFDHERFVKEEAYTTIDRRLKELTTLKESPYFGRIVFEDKEYNEEEKLYIGRFGVTPEGSYEPEIVDWRAPVASLFYKGSIGKSEYNSPSGPVEVEIEGRRQYIIKKAKLLGMFDSEIDVKDDILQLVLSSNSSEKLKDIIMTLQKEQDDIIRQPREISVVVNGVAGSGKTTVALHRVAYLLYNYREILKDRVLVIGPNDIFLEYIGTVLPSLGETGVKQTTFHRFALELLNISEVMSFKDYAERILQKDEDFLRRAAYKNSEAYLEELDKKLEEMNESYFKPESVYFSGEEIVSLKEVKELFNVHYSYMPLFRRSEKIKRILVSKLKDKRDEEVRKLKLEIEAYKNSLTSEQLKIEENNIEFNRRLRIRGIIREVMHQRDVLNSWINPEDIVDIYNEFNNNLPLTQDDLAPILYFYLKLKDIKFKENIKHVVIDEAQDLTSLQLRLIKELTKATSYTIVGDYNQRLIGVDSAPAMKNLKEIFSEASLKEFSLNKSYRSTVEIMEYANRYLKEEKIVPMVRNGSSVKELAIEGGEALGSTVEKIIKEYKDKGLENIAIIAPTLSEIKEAEKVIKENYHLTVIDREEFIYQGGVVMLPSYFAKGLEFDGVIVLNKISASPSDHIRYIMCTRALHELAEISY
ncbi:HelD family protein [Alloiococcus sp. CFN-8]|uniref:HelD family protein n=1 Tax=Alloiococcus sp. CFN-8 TaxID=3416081 RepID=UPI003CFB0927